MCETKTVQFAINLSNFRTDPVAIVRAAVAGAIGHHLFERRVHPHLESSATDHARKRLCNAESFIQRNQRARVTREPLHAPGFGLAHRKRTAQVSGENKFRSDRSSHRSDYSPFPCSPLLASTLRKSPSPAKFSSTATGISTAASFLRPRAAAKEPAPTCGWLHTPPRCHWSQEHWFAFGSSWGKQTKSWGGDWRRMTDRAHLCELSMPCFTAVESITRVARAHPRSSVRAAASLVDSNHASGQLSTH